MPASFPSAVKTFTTRNPGNVIASAIANDLQDEVTAIESGYLTGTAPINASNATFHTLSASGGSTLASSMTIGTVPYVFPSSGGTVGQFLGIASTSGSTLTLAWSSPSAGVIDRLSTGFSTNGSSAETTVYSVSISSGTIGTNKTLHLSAFGDVKNNLGGGITFTVRVKFGATTIFQVAMTNFVTSANVTALLLDSEITATGAANTQAAKTVLFLDGAAASNVAGVAPTRDFVSANDATVASVGGTYNYAGHNAMTEDTTAAKTLSITMQASDPSVNIIKRLHWAYVELK